MKKRTVAVVLSLCMCLLTGAEANIAGAADFSSEEAVVSTETAAAEADTVSAENGTEDSKGAEIVSAEEAVSGQEALAETEETADDTEDNNNTEGADEQVSQQTDAAEETLDVIFDDGGDVQTAAEAPAAEEEIQESAGETESFEAFENTNKLLYTRWKYDSDAGKWRLKKYQETTADSAGSAEAAAVSETESIEAAAAAETESAETAAAPETESAEATAGAETESAEVAAAAEAPAVEESSAEEAGLTLAEEYYTSDDGLVKITTYLSTDGTTSMTGTYAFDSSGYLLTGSQSIGGSSYYLKTSSDVTVDSDKENVDSSYSTTPTPFNSALGQPLTGWRWNGSAWESYASDGKKASLKEGIYEISGSTYYLKSNGVPYVGGKSNFTYNGKKGTYYFQPKSSSSDIPGKMAKSKWCLITSNGVKYYRYFNANGQYEKKAAGAHKIEGKTYLLRASGALVINKPLTTASGAQYFSDKNGVIRCSQLVSYNGYKYYYGSNGKRVSWKNCWKRIASKDNDYYYFGSVSGRVQVKTGWQKITVSGKYKGWYYFTSSGKMWKSRWNSKKTYYFCSDGHLASGLTKIGNDYYYFQKSTSSKRRGTKYVSAWIKDKKNGKNVIYRASSAKNNGKLVKSGWYKSKGYYYYLKNYLLVTNKTELYNTKTKEWGAVDSNGKFGNGWMVMNDSQNKVTYVSKTNGKIPKSTVITIDGKEYRFDEKGYRVNDRTTETAYANLSSYYLVCDRANGVMTVYTDKTMKVPVKTIRVSVGNPVTLTRLGTFTLKKADRWQLLMGPSYGQYGTHVSGGIYVHSIACTYPNSYNLPVAEYLKLGSPASHGCIRCCVADAKWVYDHCNGSKIKIIAGTYVSQNGLKGPLGRNPITPLRGSKNFDPTDPACS